MSYGGRAADAALLEALQTWRDRPLPGPLAGAVPGVRRGGRLTPSLAGCEELLHGHVGGADQRPRSAWPRRPARPRGRSEPEAPASTWPLRSAGSLWREAGPFGARFKAEYDRCADACDGLFPAIALADASRDGRALGHPHPVYIPVEGHEELHRRPSSTAGLLPCAQRSRYQRSAGIRHRSPTPS